LRAAVGKICPRCGQGLPLIGEDHEFSQGGLIRRRYCYAVTGRAVLARVDAEVKSG
jgi:hypothetical protein